MNKLQIIRQINTNNSAIGQYYWNSKLLKDMYSLEDNDKGLKNSMSLSLLKELKQKTITAIPITDAYDYEVEIYKSPRFTKQYGFDMYMLHLLGVPAYDGILIHPLNKSSETEGCLGVGKSKGVNFIGASRIAYKELLTLFAPILGFTISMKGTMPIINPIKGFVQKEKLFVNIKTNY